MSAANKRRGASWELDLLKYFRNEGIDAERLRLTGKADEGDLVLKIGGIPYVVEAKNVAKIDLASYVREAEVEARNYGAHRALDFLPNHAAIVKRRNHGVGEAYVVMPLTEWLNQIVDTVRKPF